jgi:cytochrome c oxidase assembly factor CtaG
MSLEMQVLLTGWDFAPSIVIGVLALAAIYLLSAGPLRRRFEGSSPVPRSQKAWFLGGLLALFIALVSPLDTIGDEYLFSAHMIQHLILTLIVPPMLLVGTPGWMLRPLIRPAAVKRLAVWLTMPVVAYTLFNLDFLIWHFPPLYDATLESEAIHIFEHLSFITLGVLNWWPVLSPLTELPALSKPAQILYLFLEAIPSSILGGIIVFAHSVLYPMYAEAPRMFGISAMTDQQISGFIMWMPGGMAYLLALSLVFFSWLSREEGIQQKEML